MPELSDEARQLREKLFDGLATVSVFAQSVNRTERCVQRFIAAGLPVTRMGKTPYVIVSEARDWLFKNASRHEPVRRGRPRKVITN